MTKTCDQIASVYIEADKIGQILNNLHIQWECQTQLKIVFKRFSYFDKAMKASDKARQLEAAISEAEENEVYKYLFVEKICNALKG